MRNRLFCAAVLTSSISYAATPVDGWYTSAFGGYTFFPDNVYTTTPSGSFLNGSGYNAGYNAGGRVGYQSHPLRYEVEYTYLHGNTSHFDLDFIEQTEATGYTSANLFMANVYYDCPEFLPSLSPYLGFGIGYAYLQAVLNALGPTSASYFSTDDSAFAYQGTAGVTYNFAENYAINLAYRYVASDKTSGFGRVYQAHVASAGVVYRFDRGNYK